LLAAATAVILSGANLACAQSDGTAAGTRSFLCRTKNTLVSNRNSGVPLDVDLDAKIVDTAFLIPFRTGANVTCRLRYADQVQGPVIQDEKPMTPQEQRDAGLLAMTANMFATPFCYTSSIHPDLHVDPFTLDEDGNGRSQFVRIDGSELTFGMEDGHDGFFGKMPGATYALNLKTGSLTRNGEPYGTCRRHGQQ
jgi:hypothetical protein